MAVKTVMNTLEYTCCFCNKSIEPSDTDPADVNVLINIDKAKEQQCNQSFYCHVACFKATLHDAVKIHFHMDSILGPVSQDEVDDFLSKLFKKDC